MAIACLLAFPSAADCKMFKFHHLGLIVKDMDKAEETLCEIIGIGLDDPLIDRFTGKENKTTMLPLGEEADHNYFEVMQPINQDWMNEYFKKYLAEGVFHIVFLIDCWDEKVQDLRNKGFTVNVSESVNPFPGCKLLREAYVMPKDSTSRILIDLIDAVHFPASLGGLAQ
jgi:hypothetical protein